MGNSTRKEIFILLLCLIIGFVLRFYKFDQKSLWIDEIHTFNDSRDDIKSQIEFYRENPTYLQAPLFFVLTHFFYPFSNPERDLRILPLIFGTLSVPLFYFVAKLFSPTIALSCALSLTFMTYHISLSQEGRSYSLIMFLGLVGLYYFFKHLKTSKKRYLLWVALFYSISFITSYSSIPFIFLSQLLWFYQPEGDRPPPRFFSFVTLNGLILLFCLPWILFLWFNFKSQTFTISLYSEDLGTFGNTLYGVLHDWLPNAPLVILSGILWILFPIVSNKRNAIVLWAIFILPVGGLYLYCRVFNITHFITSRYFITFLPLFFITLFLSLNAVENRFEGLRKLKRLKLLFILFLILSNLVILPFYYRSEKQDFRGLVQYLKGHLEEGDKVVVGSQVFIAGMLHYFEIYPKPNDRHYMISYSIVPDNEREFQVPLVMGDKHFTITHSKTYWNQYLTERNRLWIVGVTKPIAKEIKAIPYTTLKGYFDGSFVNFNRFPTDASMYLFLWDPQSKDEKGIDISIE